jgi:hypothetical protein
MTTNSLERHSRNQQLSKAATETDHGDNEINLFRVLRELSVAMLFVTFDSIVTRR